MKTYTDKLRKGFKACWSLQRHTIYMCFFHRHETHSKNPIEVFMINLIVSSLSAGSFFPTLASKIPPLSIFSETHIHVSCHCENHLENHPNPKTPAMSSPSCTSHSVDEPKNHLLWDSSVQIVLSASTTEVS